jgi:hypothetical protein
MIDRPIWIKMAMKVEEAYYKHYKFTVRNGVKVIHMSELLAKPKTHYLH